MLARLAGRWRARRLSAAQRVYLHDSFIIAPCRKFPLAQTRRMTIIITCALEKARLIFLGSSMAEHPAVNRRVVGSSPTRGAMKFKRFAFASRFFVALLGGIGILLTKACRARGGIRWVLPRWLYVVQTPLWVGYATSPRLLWCRIGLGQYGLF